MLKGLFKDGNWKTMGIGAIAGTLLAGTVAAIIGVATKKKDSDIEVVDYTIEDAPANESNDSEA